MMQPLSDAIIYFAQVADWLVQENVKEAQEGGRRFTNPLPVLPDLLKQGLENVQAFTEHSLSNEQDKGDTNNGKLSTNSSVKNKGKEERVHFQDYPLLPFRDQQPDPSVPTWPEQSIESNIRALYLVAEQIELLYNFIPDLQIIMSHISLTFLVNKKILSKKIDTIISQLNNLAQIHFILYR